uniref:Uncharacterized protein n=1 Tax=Chromera velia CCMP2878 TaxID=1169474 RepID=A0A0G4FPJ8_9ALVE|eukprot:Cvel_18001.t1-p1 / transcript=Cvel_18001.t1 / gene=Cvel_18001 / organism=Chromera_velia_CCMP2878 / gene_product=hypothetical protein / transcript_product=hypothetical protein / location=Cvel_scaffold1467:30795-32790(+) / protein_length=354 / sequence_SO=supercontig / SO=protein_coding / is_pseudo=false
MRTFEYNHRLGSEFLLGAPVYRYHKLYGTQSAVRRPNPNVDSLIEPQKENGELPVQDEHQSCIALACRLQPGDKWHLFLRSEGVLRDFPINQIDRILQLTSHDLQWVLRSDHLSDLKASDLDSFPRLLKDMQEEVKTAGRQRQGRGEETAFQRTLVRCHLTPPKAVVAVQIAFLVKDTDGGQALKKAGGGASACASSSSHLSSSSSSPPGPLSSPPPPDLWGEFRGPARAEAEGDDPDTPGARLSLQKRGRVARSIRRLAQAALDESRAELERELGSGDVLTAEGSVGVSSGIEQRLHQWCGLGGRRRPFAVSPCVPGGEGGDAVRLGAAGQGGGEGGAALGGGGAGGSGLCGD